MTKNEIRSLIEQKIAGQGTNVDAGGALPAILEALVDAVDAVEESKPVEIEIPLGEEFMAATKAVAAERLEITESQLDDLIEGKYPIVRNKLTSAAYLCLVTEQNTSNANVKLFAYYSDSGYLKAFWNIGHESNSYYVGEDSVSDPKIK